MGKKFGQILIPNTAFTILLREIDKSYGIGIPLQEMLIYNVIFAILYILLWHELRMRKMEGEKNGEKTKK